jgi:hypothetical protein
MKNTVIFDKQRTVYLVIEPQLRDNPVQSAWREEKDAQEMAEILNAESFSTAHVQTVLMDQDTPEGIGYQVLVSVNTGEQIEDDMISMNQRCVYYPEDTPAYAHNFVMFDDKEKAAIGGENPRIINGKWMVHHTELSWEDFLKDEELQDELEECNIYSSAPTKEQALEFARATINEIIEELERIRELHSSSE